MAFDEKLAERVRAELATEKTLVEIKMFGGLCFKVNGHMACGILNDYLIVKCDREEYEQLMKEAHTKEFDFTGKPMRGVLMVKPAGVKTAHGLKRWIGKGVETAKAKPAKANKKRIKKLTK